MKLFPSVGHIDFKSMHKLLTFSNITQNRKYIVDKKDKYLKVAWVTLTSQMTETYGAYMFFYHCHNSYCISKFLVIYKGVQFTRKSFTIMCAFFSAKHVSTKMNHLQCNGQAIKYNKITLTWIRHNLSKHEKNVYTFVQLFTETQNMQVHQSIDQNSHSPQVCQTQSRTFRFEQPSCQ